MKRSIITRTLPFALSVSAMLLISPASAQTVNTCEATSYLILPGGQCLDLGYLESLSEGRDNMQVVETIYQQEFMANVDQERLNLIDPDYETEEEEEARYRHLAETRQFRDDMSEVTQDLEDICFRINTRNMAIVRDAFVHHLYD